VAVDTEAWPSLRVAAPPRQPRARVEPLRFPALPATLLVQLAGGAATLAGVWLAFGLAAVLIVGGLAATVLGALREAGRV
jgi:hypothetical protein